MTIPPKSQPAFGSAPTDFGGFGETLFTERGHSTVANGFAAPSPPAKSFPNLGRTPRVQVFGSVVEVEDHRLHTREVRAEPIFDPRPPVAATLVRGINLVTLAWSDGDSVYPTEDLKRNKNEHFREMLVTAQARGFTPRYVCFDSWYSGKENLKAVRNQGWHFLTPVRSNRRVNLDRTGNKSISEQPIAESGTVVHVEVFGLVKAFRIVALDGDTEYHRGLKQCTEVERGQARLARSQRNHIGFALRAFVRLEWHRFHSGITWYEAKIGIVRDGVRAYVCDPKYNLPQMATA